MLLTTEIGGKRTSGMIVEVEAYVGKVDRACHAHIGRTSRNSVMFETGGHIYVYFIYGMHHCVNVVTEPNGQGCAVLIRAIQPIEGVEIMQRRRKNRHPTNLSNGPAKLCVALGIDKKISGEDLLNSNLVKVSKYKTFTSKQIARSKRIGITKDSDRLWRFYIRSNKWVS